MNSDSVSEYGEEVYRLQKYLARCGVASRRASEKLITSGRVSVNGAVITELGSKVIAGTDEVCVDGLPVFLQAQDVTLMLNKPAGYVTTMNDPQDRLCVAGLIPLDKYPSLYPVGRLDRDTTGLLLFSTDGQLGNLLLHPSHHVGKTYVVACLGAPDDAALACLRDGVELADGITQPARVLLLQGEEAAAARLLFDFDSPGASGESELAQKTLRSKKHRHQPLSYLRITIHEGRNRQVRRMFEAVGYPVIALHRDSFGPLSLEDLPRGKWRKLTNSELEQLSTTLRD